MERWSSDTDEEKYTNSDKKPKCLFVQWPVITPGLRLI